MDESNLKVESGKMLRPWWKEPMAIGFGVLILGAGIFVMCQGWTPPTADPTGRKTPVAGGGSFCDSGSQAQGTLENPSTQINPDEHRTSNVLRPTSK